MRQPWQDHVTATRPWRIRHALGRPLPDCEHFTIAGDQDDAGKPHTDRYRAAGLPNLHILAVAGVGHAVARAMRQAGCLVLVLALLVEGEPAGGRTVQAACAVPGFSVRLG